MPGVEVIGPTTPQADEVLTAEALAFVASLHRLDRKSVV